jgi:hypothetical protein
MLPEFNIGGQDINLDLTANELPHRCIQSEEI